MPRLEFRVEEEELLLELLLNLEKARGVAQGHQAQHMFLLLLLLLLMLLWVREGLVGVATVGVWVGRQRMRVGMCMDHRSSRRPRRAWPRCCLARST